MKIGTDAVLLGASTSPLHCQNIIDIGTGCGILALMLAQKSKAFIDAVEIDALSAAAALDNFKNSPWSERLNIFNISVQDYVVQTKTKYDLIISNPPFFQNSLLSADAKMNTAKHNVYLSLKSLAEAADVLINDSGQFSAILPYSLAHELETHCNKFHLHLIKKTIIIPQKNKQPNRVILLFEKSSEIKVFSEEILFLRNYSGSYSNQYKELTKDYLLDF